MQIVIRTDAHPDIGMGHLMRMLALADWLRFQHVQSVFVLTHFEDARFTEAFAELVQKRIGEFAQEFHWVPQLDSLREAQSLVEQFPAADWFVLDSYRLPQLWLDTMVDLRRRVCVLDDHPRLKRHADVVVDPTLFSSRSSGHSAETCYAGADYFLAAVELARQHFLLEPYQRGSTSDIRHWFVSFGGTDVKAMLPHTLRILAELVGAEARVDIAVNPSVTHLDEIQAARRRFKGETRIIYESEEIFRALSTCDFAIGAAGGMTLERALLGVPALTTYVADNQEEIYRRLDVEQLSYTLEPDAFTVGTALREKLVEILEQFESRSTMSRRSLILSQGLGASWLGQYLCRHKHSDIYLRRPSAEFRERLFMWQSVPEVRRHSRNPAAPSWQEHCAWYEKRVTSHNSVMAEICSQDCSVGMLRLDRKNSEPLQFEVSILIAPDFHGRGIAPMALRLARRLVPFGDFLAYIRPENRASLRAFAAAGYQPSSQPDYFRREAIYANTH